MSKMILVAYASKLGATAGIADKITEILREQGHQAEAVPAAKVNDLENYQAVVLGSAVYIGRWRKEAVNFLKRFETKLGEMPVWFFSSGPLGKGDPVELLDGWTFPPPQQEIADRVQPRGVTVFHGMLDRSTLNFIERFMLDRMGAQEGDFRDWEMISSWARQISADLSR
jgi:menaquinone-dependent protoporphyrinogen oxidase